MNVCVEIHDGPLGAPVAFGAEGVGALVCFEGLVRPTESEEPIAALDYQVYSPMAEQMLEALGRELIERYRLLAIATEHSRGRVPVGACSFRLRIASRHRREALAAMEEFIDRLKQEVPIWKKAVPVTAPAEVMP